MYEDDGHEDRLKNNRIRRLHQLEEKAAFLGINTPPEVLMEIEDLRKGIHAEDNIEPSMNPREDEENIEIPFPDSKKLPSLQKGKLDIRKGLSDRQNRPSKKKDVQWLAAIAAIIGLPITIFALARDVFNITFDMGSSITHSGVTAVIAATPFVTTATKTEEATPVRGADTDGNINSSASQTLSFVQDRFDDVPKDTRVETGAGLTQRYRMRLQENQYIYGVTAYFSSLAVQENGCIAFAVRGPGEYEITLSSGAWQEAIYTDVTEVDGHLQGLVADLKKQANCQNSQVETILLP